MHTSFISTSPNVSVRFFCNFTFTHSTLPLSHTFKTKSQIYFSGLSHVLLYRRLILALIKFLSLKNLKSQFLLYVKIKFYFKFFINFSSLFFKITKDLKPNFKNINPLLISILLKFQKKKKLYF